MTFRPPFARAREINRNVVRDPQPEGAVPVPLPSAPRAVAAPPPVIIATPAPVVEAPVPAAVVAPPVAVPPEVEVPTPAPVMEAPVVETSTATSLTEEPVWSSKMKKSELLEIALKHGLDVAEETSKNELMRKLERAGI